MSDGCQPTIGEAQRNLEIPAKMNPNLITPDVVKNFFHNTLLKQPSLSKIHVKHIIFLSIIIIQTYYKCGIFDKYHWAVFCI